MWIVCTDDSYLMTRLGFSEQIVKNVVCYKFCLAFSGLRLNAHVSSDLDCSPHLQDGLFSLAILMNLISPVTMLICRLQTEQKTAKSMPNIMDVNYAHSMVKRQSNHAPKTVPTKQHNALRSATYFYHIYPKYWDLWTYHTCPNIWNSQFYYLLICLKYFCMYGNQCRPWSDAAFCGVWSGSTLFAKACLSQYLWLLRQALLRSIFSSKPNATGGA